MLVEVDRRVNAPRYIGEVILQKDLIMIGLSFMDSNTKK